jgi:hypothetical protein
LQVALAQARKAMNEVQKVEEKLFEADLQAGRARTIIKKSGFADVLRRKNSIIQITESNCMSHSLYLMLLASTHIIQLVDALQPFLEDFTSQSHWTSCILCFVCVLCVLYVLLFCIVAVSA